MTLHFFGAAREVTGSNMLIETGNSKVLLECGFFQGTKFAEERNFSPFAYDPNTIDAIILCHAHLDHTGRIPKLYKEGFRGKIFSTAPTKELARLVLEDSLKLMQEESKRDKHPVLYSREDLSGVMELFECIGYGERLEIARDVFLTFKNAGHILGSALAFIEAEGKKIAYTSDLGNKPSQLLNPPEYIEEADFVICESTYGGRVHEDISKRQEKLNAIIAATIENNSVLMIPTFAIERTQELLADIEHYCTGANCVLPGFYLDSPLAEKATAVFQKYPEYLNDKIDKGNLEGFFGLARVKMTASVEESKSILGAPSPKIIIAGSGMMNGGRILYHLQDYVEDSKNTLLIVGYVAKGTLGRRILDGDKTIKIFGKPFSVNCQVKAIGSYSAHADSIQILDWLKHISGVRNVFLVHGEVEEALALAKVVRDNLKVDCQMPQAGESYNL